MRKLILLFVSVVLLSSCDEGRDQYNNWLTGKWEFNDKTEYINFFDDDVFIMNDTIQGSYEVQDGDDKDLWYYYISKSGLTTGYGIMSFSDVSKNKMTVYGMPLHEEEQIEIYRKCMNYVRIT